MGAAGALRPRPSQVSRYPERKALDMTARRFLTAASSAMLAAALCGCGSGRAGLNQFPPPPNAALPPPSATPDDASVELLANPVTQELAVATSDGPIRIRYDAAQNKYEVAASGGDWSELTDPLEYQAAPNRYFNVAGQSGSAYFSIRAHHRSTDPDRTYRYSNLASWRTSSSLGGEWGNIAAFGAPTPASGIPMSGSASFVGFAAGAADIANDAWGSTTTTPLEGTVRMNFDFAAGTLSGSLALASACDCSTLVSTGPLSFSNTAFARGSQTFSGSFATGVDGINAFQGRFTGPGADELIASWSLPFLFDGARHQARGAWIAKRGN